jgi:fucose 4-O-acetylase-like acetyltransferase
MTATHPATTNRNDWVDYAKAIGIILVVIGHVMRGLVSAGLPVDRYWFSLVDSIIYSFHMPLFFFISGLFFSDSLNKRGPGRLIASKVDSIIYPYIVWSLLQGLFELAFSQYTNGQVTLGQVLSFGWHPRAQFWFLFALFFVFVLATFVITLTRGRYVLSLLVLLGTIFVVKSELPLNLITNYLAGYSVFFLFGVWLNPHMKSL